MIPDDIQHAPAELQVVYFDGLAGALEALEKVFKQQIHPVIDVTLVFPPGPPRLNLFGSDKAGPDNDINRRQRVVEILLTPPNHQRIKSLKYIGDPHPFFLPSPSLPNLRALDVNLIDAQMAYAAATANTKSTARSGPAKGKTGRPVKGLPAKEPAQPNPFEKLNPAIIESLIVRCVLPSAITFAGQCTNLTSLRITLPLSDPIDVPTPARLELPNLRELFFMGQPNRLKSYFLKLYNLEHLTVVGGRSLTGYRIKINSNPRKDILVPPSAVFGVYPGWEAHGLSTDGWPYMPELRTLTLDHGDMVNLVPTLGASKKLEAIHLHGNWGFIGLLHWLGARETDGGAPFRDFFLQNATLADIPPRVLHLKTLRLWMCASEPEVPRALLEKQLQQAQLIPCLRRLLELRPGLRIELGALKPDAKRPVNPAQTQAVKDQYALMVSVWRNQVSAAGTTPGWDDTTMNDPGSAAPSPFSLTGFDMDGSTPRDTPVSEEGDEGSALGSEMDATTPPVASTSGNVKKINRKNKGWSRKKATNKRKRAGSDVAGRDDVDTPGAGPGPGPSGLSQWVTLAPSDTETIRIALPASPPPLPPAQAPGVDESYVPPWKGMWDWKTLVNAVNDAGFPVQLRRNISLITEYERDIEVECEERHLLGKVPLPQVYP